MFADVKLRELAGMTAPERAFLSVYVSGPRAAANLDSKFRKVRRVLARGAGGAGGPGGPAEKDERVHFDENVSAVLEYLRKHELESGSLALFSCWANDFFLAVPLPPGLGGTVPVKDLIWIDSSPYIRPLARLQDDYENVAVVVADNRKARIFVVSSAVAGDEDVVRGNVKNHVKKGGWSQQRYERRRDKQIKLYAREVVDALETLDREEEFRRVLMVGGREVLRAIHENLPHGLKGKVVSKALDLKRGEGEIDRDIMELLEEGERASERELWEKIRSEYMRGGLGAVGLDEVLAAAGEGRVETMIVDGAFRPEGRRCRDCERLEVGALDGRAGACPACGSASLFEVDVVNEIVEMLKLTGAEADFAEGLPGLREAGGIAALLRYRL